MAQAKKSKSSKPKVKTLANRTTTASTNKSTVTKKSTVQLKPNGTFVTTTVKEYKPKSVAKAKTTPKPKTTSKPKSVAKAQTAPKPKTVNKFAGTDDVYTTKNHIVAVRVETQRGGRLVEKKSYYVKNANNLSQARDIYGRLQNRAR